MVSEVTTSLRAEYGKVGKMITKREKKHDYPGMTRDFSKDGKFIDVTEELLLLTCSDQR